MITSTIPVHYPFYQIDLSRDRPRLIGSGVLFEVYEHSFLLSAAHVFDQLGGELAFPEAGVEEPVKVHVTTTAPDVVDQGVALLPAGIANLLRERYSFVSVDDLDVFDRFESTKKYSFTGFPSTRARPRFNSRTIDIDHFEYSLEPVSLEESATKPWHPAVHLAGRFKRDEMRFSGGPRITAPEPNGISGGGVWTNQGSSGFKLVGIGTEWDHKNNLMIGVRIGAVLALIKNAFPQLQDAFPDDPRIKIKFA